MEIGVGAAVLIDGRPGVVVEGPDEGGQFLVEYSLAGGDLDTAWCALDDPRLQARDT